MLLMEYLKDSFDTGQMKMDFPTPNQSRDTEVHILSLTLNNMKVARSTIYLPDLILGRNLCNLHSSGRKAQVSSLPEQRGVTEFSHYNWVYPNP